MKSKWVASIFILGFSTLSLADGPLGAPAPQSAPNTVPLQMAPGKGMPPQNGMPGSQRKTSIDFENEVVEGMNRNPLDSVEHVGQQDDENQHLYRKRRDYKKEIPVLVQEMGFSQ